MNKISQTSLIGVLSKKKIEKSDNLSKKIYQRHKLNRKKKHKHGALNSEDSNESQIGIRPKNRRLKDYYNVRKQLFGEVQHELSQRFIPKKMQDLNMLDPLLILDNKKNDLKIAYRIDKGALNIIGRNGTPVKSRIPEPNIMNEKTDERIKDPMEQSKNII